MADKDLARIAALLRKAEGTDNQHEADAFLQAAQRLATLAAVDLAVARAHTTKTERRATPTQRTITIGDAGKRGLRTYVDLFLAIGRANNVTCDIARDSTRVYAYGFETDIDTAEAIYSSLVVQMVRASDAYIKSGEYAREWVMKQVRTPTSASTPLVGADREPVRARREARASQHRADQLPAGLRRPDRRAPRGGPAAGGAAGPAQGRGRRAVSG